MSLFKFILSAVIGLSFFGCAHAGVFVPKKEIQEVVTVVHAATNLVPVAGGTPVTVVTPEKRVTNLVETTSYVVSPDIETLIQAAQGINTVNPTPYAPMISVALALITGVLGWFARRKQKEASVVPTLIKQIDKSTDTALKGKIKTAATKADVETELNKAVVKNT